MNSPCKDCQDRHAHCHSACNRYGEYAAMFEKIRAQRLADAAADAADAEHGIRSAAMSENTDYTKQERVERRESQTTPYPGIAESR